MASETFKKMIVSEGITLLDDGETPVCNEPACTEKAAYKIECGNTVVYSCKEHLAAAKTRISADGTIDDEERVCSQGGPNDLGKTMLTTPTY